MVIFQQQNTVLLIFCPTIESIYIKTMVYVRSYIWCVIQKMLFCTVSIKLLSDLDNVLLVPGALTHGAEGLPRRVNLFL